jgi:hypothetical protein
MVAGAAGLLEGSAAGAVAGAAGLLEGGAGVVAGPDVGLGVCPQAATARATAATREAGARRRYADISTFSSRLCKRSVPDGEARVSQLADTAAVSWPTPRNHGLAGLPMARENLGYAG